MKNLIKQLLRENLENDKIVRLYHRIGNKKNLNLSELIRSVLTNGLKPNDNGEVGSVIWFSKDFKDYGANGSFVVAYDYDKTKGYEENNGIHYPSYSPPFGYEQIPFEKLVIIKIPIANIRGNILTNEDLIRWINENNRTADEFNKLRGDVVLFGDLFNLYVQPKIKIPNFLDGIDKKVINIHKVF